MTTPDSHLILPCRVTTSFKYVGSKVNNFADMSDEIVVRAQMMNAAFRRHKANLLTNFGLSRQLCLKAFVAFCLSAALYGCETWSSLQSEIDYLESHQFRLLRRVLGYTWKDSKSFAALIDEGRRSGVDILPIGVMVARARLAYFGHVLRMDESRLPKAFLCAQLTCGSEKRAPGHEQSYKAVILDDLKEFSIVNKKCSFSTNAAEVDWANLVKLAEDRVAWRKAVKTDGVKIYMTTWYAARALESNKRHKKTDGDNYVPKTAFEFHHIVKLADLAAAINSGAVCVGRGTQHRRSRHANKQDVQPATSSTARIMLNNLKDLK